jgi:hypothetical protein
MELELKRIADSFEAIVILAGRPVARPASTEASDAKPGELLPGTVEELKALAQKIAAALPEGGIVDFTEYVRALCTKVGVKKLLEIPKASITDTAKALLAYKKKE